MTNQEKYDLYRAHPFISQSELKGKNLSNSPSLQRGNVLDCLVTNPEEFNDIYEVVKKVPTPAIKNICDLFYDRWDMIETDIFKYREPLMKVVTELDFGKGNYKWERVKSEIEKKGGLEYWNLLVTTGKIVITEKDKVEGQKMANKILKHKFTREFFEGDYERTFQHEIYKENFYGLDVKGLVDLKLTDETYRHYIDIKSIFNHKFWAKNFFEYRYDIQLPFYADIDEDPLPLGKLIYIFVDNIHPYPIVYEMEDFVINMGKYGQSKYIIGYVNDDINQPVYKRLKKPNKGYLQLIEDYKVAQVLPQIKDVSPELLITNGRVKLSNI